MRFFPVNFSQYLLCFYLPFQSISSIVLTCATATFYATSFQCIGIPAISAHCTNAANIHVSFRRNFSQTYTLSAEQTVTAFLRKGQNARYVLSLNSIQDEVMTSAVNNCHRIICCVYNFTCVSLSFFVCVCKKSN